MTTVLKRTRRRPKGPPSDPNDAKLYWRNRFKSCYGVELSIKDPESGTTDIHAWPKADKDELNAKAAELWPDDPFVDDVGNPIVL